MDGRLIRFLNAQNELFYRENAQSFSDTRQSPWDGWGNVCDALAELVPCSGELSVLDAACGNFRFERYAAARLSDVQCSFACVDACDDLASNSPDRVTYASADIIGSLFEGREWAPHKAGGFDAAVSFGFLHHIPSFELRIRFLLDLASCVWVGGVVAVSAWMFAEDERFAIKASAAHARNFAALEARGTDLTGLEDGDYLLDWSGSGAIRYCHTFSCAEVDELCESVSNTLLLRERYRSDGPGGDSNCYLIFERRG